MGRDKVELIVRRKGYIVSKLATEADLADDQQLRRLLVDVVSGTGETNPRSATTRWRSATPAPAERP
jgi:hypothetical protein